MNQARHISVSIDRSVAEVYEFTSKTENLPAWASGLGGSIENIEGQWIAETPMGPAEIRFCEENSFGVLDHDVILDSGARFYNPMRVVANGNGSEVTFTLFKTPEMDAEKFAQDIEWVNKDLNTLKSVLESVPS